MFFWILFFVVVRGEFVSTRYTCNATYQFFGSDGLLETTFSLEDILVREYDEVSGICLVKYGLDRNMIKFFHCFDNCKLEYDPTLAPKATISQVNLDYAARLLESDIGIWKAYRRTPEGIPITFIWKSQEENNFLFGVGPLRYGNNIGLQFMLKQTCLKTL